MGVDAADLPAVLGAPECDHLVHAPGREDVLVRLERYARHGVLMMINSDRAVVADAPQCRSAVVTHCNEQADVSIAP